MGVAKVWQKATMGVEKVWHMASVARPSRGKNKDIYLGWLAYQSNYPY